MPVEMKSIPEKSGRLLKLVAACALFSVGWSAEAHSVMGTQSRSRPADGGALFRLNCSSSYCHGEQGKGGGAPSLRGRVFERSRLSRVIGSGIPGTAMPAFASRFSAAEIDGLIAYIRSIAALPLDEPPSAGGSAPIVTLFPGTAPGSRGEQTPIEEGAQGTVMAVGRDIFFDASAIGNCRVCHSFQGQGGKVGPDLSRLGMRSEEEIRESILDPSAKIVAGFETLQIVTRGGLRVVGVKRDENADRVRIFDTSTMPPVSRAIPKAEIVSREIVTGSVMPSEPGRRLNESQLRALVAFLRNR